MEKILLTGATGFVGRQILKQLENKGHQITIVVKPNWENRISINEALTKIIEVDDIFSQTSKWWEKNLTGISTIIHTAWYAEPGLYLNSIKNDECFLGTVQLATAAKNKNVKRFVGLGSCIEYNISNKHLSIDTPLLPKTLYSKGASEKILAKELKNIFLEVIIANGFDREALNILKNKKNLRLIDSSNFKIKDLVRFNSANEAILTQSEDINKFNIKDFKIVSKKKPIKFQFKNLIFAFNICRYVKSNAIVLAANEATVGIGSGQPSRLDSCQIAIDKMHKFENFREDVVAASDAFFPFVDGIEKLVQSGVTAIIQPSGSIRDKEIIKFANQTNTILVFSKTRHFRH